MIPIRLRSMRVVAISGMVLALLFIAEAGQAIAEGYLVADENAMVGMVNAHRAGMGLRTLQGDPALQTVARRQTSRMVAAGYIYHNPNLGGEAGAAVPGWLKIGENVGVGSSAPIVEDAFLNSPHHRENIEDPSYNLIGLGAMSGNNQAMYFTQNFANKGGARPAPAPAAAPPPAGTPAPAPAARPRPAPAPAARRPAPAPAPAPKPVPPRATPRPTAPAATAPPATAPPETTTTTTPLSDEPVGGFEMGGGQPVPDVKLVSTDDAGTQGAKHRSSVGMWRTIGAMLGNVADRVLP
jgi:hypothetical protein